MPRRPLRIILTGFSGTGKSLVASLVAQRLGWQIIDTDALVEQDVGRSISDIFAREGEAYFRGLETGALRSACAVDRAVVPTGGGRVPPPHNPPPLAPRPPAGVKC